MNANRGLSRSHARPKNDDERILPLINVVFLLLIFFMVAGQLSAVDPFQIEPVRSVSDGRPESDALLVLVGAEGELAVEDQELAREDLEATIRERLAGDETRPVRLKADGRADATEVVAVMERLRAAGVERLDLLSVPGSR